MIVGIMLLKVEVPTSEMMMTLKFNGIRTKNMRRGGGETTTVGEV